MTDDGRKKTCQIEPIQIAQESRDVQMTKDEHIARDNEQEYRDDKQDSSYDEQTSRDVHTHGEMANWCEKC